jgi:hypothetical protein
MPGGWEVADRLPRVSTAATLVLLPRHRRSDEFQASCPRVVPEWVCSVLSHGEPLVVTDPPGAVLLATGEAATCRVE